MVTYANKNDKNKNNSNKKYKNNLATNVLKFSCFLLLSGQVQAATYYVAPDGDDNNDGSNAAPYATFSQANNMLTAGDTLIVKAGVYRQTMTISKSGTASQPIVIKAESDAKVVISGTEPVTGWGTYTGNIYQTNVNMLLGDEFNQVYHNGELMQIALDEGFKLNFFDEQLTQQYWQNELLSAKGKSILTGGVALSKEAHAAIAAINVALENNGKTVTYVETESTGESLDAFKTLINDVKKGGTDALVFVGTNPIYSTPSHLNTSLQWTPRDVKSSNLP